MESVVTVVRNSSAAVGSSVIMTSIMNVNGTDVQTETVSLTITGTVDTVEYIEPQVRRLPAIACTL